MCPSTKMHQTKTNTPAETRQYTGTRNYSPTQVFTNTGHRVGLWSNRFCWTVGPGVMNKSCLRDCVISFLLFWVLGCLTCPVFGKEDCSLGAWRWPSRFAELWDPNDMFCIFATLGRCQVYHGWHLLWYSPNLVCYLGHFPHAVRT